jgi:hypothetical protein
MLILEIIFGAFMGGLFGFAVIPVMSSILPLWATFICSGLFYSALFLVVYVTLEEYLR